MDGINHSVVLEKSKISAQREERVRALGRLLLEKARPYRARGGAWFERLLESMLRDQSFRVQVLRFVDVLPSLRDDDELVRHLDEYFAASKELPALVGWGLSKARYSPKLTAILVRKALMLVATRFIGGRNASEALDTVLDLRRQNLGFSLDLLGEAVVSEKEADQFQAAYLKMLDELGPEILKAAPLARLDRIDGRIGPGLYLSLKPTSLYSQSSPVNFQGSIEGISRRLQPLLLSAREHKAFVCIDMEQYEFKPILLETFKQLLLKDGLRDWPDVGIAIQAYLKESPDDIATLADWAKARGTPVTVRLVRGAYWDYETVIARQHGWKIPVWTEKSATDWCYEQCLERLFGHYPYLRTAVATHNPRSMAYAMAVAEEHNLSADQFEFQMLYGMAQDLQRAIADLGHCLRVYVPFGEPVPGMAYLVRRLLENSSGQSLFFSRRNEDANDSLLFAAPVPPVAAKSEDPARTSMGSGSKSGNPGRFTNEPLHRYTDATERELMAHAIEQAKLELGREYPVRIDGRMVSTKDWIESLNPADPSQVIGRVGSAGLEQADLAIRGALNAFQSWSVKSANERAAVLIRAAGLLRARREQFAALEILEAGKTWGEADANVTEAIDFLEFYARDAIRLEMSDTQNLPGEHNDYRLTPLGVGVVIPPWNFPLAILTGLVSASLAAGNTVILKPSSQTPVIAARFVDLLSEAGLPAGVLQYLPGSGALVGQHLAEHPDTNFIVFTGSESVGTALIETAARRRAGQRHVKRVIAEMGGKNAIIVDQDAELDETVSGIVRSAFGYQGQKCSACSRLIVIGNQYRHLIERLVDATRSLKIGNPADPSVNFGPVIEYLAMQRIQKMIEEGRRAAKLELALSGPPDARGFFVGPTIFSDVPQDSALFREEIFGPVLSVLHAADLDQALALANDCAYALTGGFYSRSPSHIERVKREFQVGNLYINRSITGALVSRQPFGGFRMSGVGSKAGGPSYLSQFMHQRTLTENTLRRGFAPDSGLE